MSNHIIAIYHYFVQNTNRIYCVVSRPLEILFQRNDAVSPSPWFFRFFAVTIFSIILPASWQDNYTLSSLSIIYKTEQTFGKIVAERVK